MVFPLLYRKMIPASLEVRVLLVINPLSGEYSDDPSYIIPTWKLVTIILITLILRIIMLFRIFLFSMQ